MGRPDLDAIEARLKAATPGPWHNAGYPLKGRDGSEVMAGAGVLLTMTCYHREAADADLVANAPTDLAALLAYVRELEEVRAERDRLLAYVWNLADLAGYHLEIAAVKPGGTGPSRMRDALTVERDALATEVDRITAERDRLARVLRCERGEWAPDGWVHIFSESRWLNPDGASVWRRWTTESGRHQYVWTWGLWRAGQWVDGTAPTALDAIEAADAAIKGAT